MRKWLSAAMAIASAIACSGSAFAADAVVGSVLAVRGAVYVEGGGKARQPLEANAAVHTGDTIESHAGKAKVALDDGTVISVGENSRVRLADYGGARGANVRLRLILGVARFSAKLAPGGSFEVETETAIAAVRGTDWVMEATPPQTAVAVVDGAVAVTGRAAAAPGTVVLEGEGLGTDVRRGSAPTPPARWSAQRFASTLARATFD